MKAYPWSRVATLAAVLILCTLPAPRTAAAQGVLLTHDQALHEIFPHAARTSVERRAIAPALKQRLHEQLGRFVEEDTVVVERVFDRSDGFRGYAVVTEELGKSQPITFMVGVTPDLKVRDVAVMVYRESRGGDVKRKRFLSQYRGKTVKDPIDVGRDIINISGATISVRSLNAGVKRVLAELTALYGGSASK